MKRGGRARVVARYRARAWARVCCVVSAARVGRHLSFFWSLRRRVLACRWCLMCAMIDAHEAPRAPPRLTELTLTCRAALVRCRLVSGQAAKSAGRQTFFVALARALAHASILSRGATAPALLARRRAARHGRRCNEQARHCAAPRAATHGRGKRGGADFLVFFVRGAPREHRVAFWVLCACVVVCMHVFRSDCVKSMHARCAALMLTGFALLCLVAIASALLPHHDFVDESPLLIAAFEAAGASISGVRASTRAICSCCSQNLSLHAVLFLPLKRNAPELTHVLIVVLLPAGVATRSVDEH